METCPPTAAVADALARLGLPVRALGLRPALPGAAVAGRVLPARHAGSVDVFLEALQAAAPGDILVVDNAGRLDEGCVGDLTALEARHRGAAGLVVWGAHRDQRELAGMGFPVWSLGACPNGPLELRPRAADALQAARLGPHQATRADVAVADDDGVVLVPAARWPEVQQAADAVVRTERAQAERVRGGTGLAEQLDLKGYLAARAKEPTATFRDHLKRRGGAIEA
ncbi:MAG: hypothetical protein QOD77_1524 [Thermoplasmata archaeon]|jgi:regulator of RNase E activity RraA|nr:hypothetical protein [Thermoplasmata archaeon]